MGYVCSSWLKPAQEDIRIMKNLNMDASRFSISWSRLIPGKVIQRAEFTLVKYGCHHLGVTQIINFYAVSNKQSNCCFHI
jgi:beta-glucosidase/6-phospho-beta-glucosidase/beta-galactosidase